MAMDNISLADIAAATDGGFGGGNSWAMIILFALIFGWGGNGFNRGDYGTYATASSQQEILFGQRFSNLDNKIDRLGNGIADATYALNNTITGEGRALQTQMAENTQRIMDALSQNKIDSLQAQVNQLQMQNAMANVVRYPTASTYCSGNNPFCGCCG